MDPTASYGLDVDLTRVCRCCLEEHDSLKTLFCNQIVSGSIVAFPAVIESVTGTKVRQDDGNPQKLCASCRSAFVVAYTLQRKFESTQRLIGDIRASAGAGPSSSTDSKLEILAFEPSPSDPLFVSVLSVEPNADFRMVAVESDCAVATTTKRSTDHQPVDADDNDNGDDDHLLTVSLDNSQDEDDNDDIADESAECTTELLDEPPPPNQPKPKPNESGSSASTSSELFRELRQLKARIKTMQRDKTHLTRDDHIVLPKLPMKDIAELQEFNQKLLDSSFKDQMIILLKKVDKSSSVNCRVANYLETLLAYSLTVQCTWTGRNAVDQRAAEASRVPFYKFVALRDLLWKTINYRSSVDVSEKLVKKAVHDYVKRASYHFQLEQNKTGIRTVQADCHVATMPRLTDHQPVEEDDHGDNNWLTMSLDNSQDEDDDDNADESASSDPTSTKLLRELRLLKAKMKTLQKDKSASDLKRDPRIDLPKLPMRDIAELEEFNQKLLDRSFEDQMILTLKNVDKLSSVNCRVANYLETLLAYSLAVQCTWTGRISVDQYEVCKVPFIKFVALKHLLWKTINYKGTVKVSEEVVKKAMHTYVNKAPFRFQVEQSKSKSGIRIAAVQADCRSFDSDSIPADHQPESAAFLSAKINTLQRDESSLDLQRTILPNLKLPLRKMADLEEFNEKLLDSSFEDQVVHLLKPFDKSASVICRICNFLERLISYSVTVQCSWTGMPCRMRRINAQVSKVPFNKFVALKYLMWRTINYNGIDKVSEQMIEKAMHDYVKRAPTRFQIEKIKKYKYKYISQTVNLDY